MYVFWIFERLSASYVKVLGIQACPPHYGAHLHVHFVEPRKDSLCDRNVIAYVTDGRMISQMPSGGK